MNCDIYYLIYKEILLLSYKNTINQNRISSNKSFPLKQEIFYKRCKKGCAVRLQYLK